MSTCVSVSEYWSLRPGHFGLVISFQELNLFKKIVTISACTVTISAKTNTISAKHFLKPFSNNFFFFHYILFPLKDSESVRGAKPW